MAVRFLSRTNIKTYPTYKMFTYDLLFYYAIIYLFLSLEKGLSPSLIFIIDAISQVSKLVLQLPCVCFLDFIGNRKSLIIANILSAISILLLLLANSFTVIVISTIIFAFSYDVKQLCETTILFDSLPNTRKKNSLFSKIDGSGLSRYFILDAISTLFSGFLFVINHYLPLLLCFATCCITTGISLRFENTDKSQENSTNKIKRHHIEELKTYFKDLRQIYKFILHSKRLKCLLTYAGIYAGMIVVCITLRSLVLTDLNVPEQYFGICFAGMQIVSAISAYCANFYQNKFKNKVLTILSFLNAIPLILLGISMFFKWNIYVIYVFYGLWLFLYGLTKGPFYTLIKRYLHSFVTTEVNTKIYAFSIIFECAFGTVFSLLASFLFDHVSVATGIILIGVFLSIIFILILDYMKSYVGLKPEEYKKSEITFTKLN
jgi:hypothetical protein